MKMALIICICDLWRNREYLRVESSGEHISKLTNISKNSKKSKDDNSLTTSLPITLKRLRLMVDGTSALYLIRELKQFSELRKWICTNPALRGLELLWIELVPPDKEIIDYKWNRMVAHTLWEQIEIEHLMSWLSTLGGGFSALGEQFSQCAQTAGKISLKQLSIGLRLGDPFLQARCKLFYSISLIQTGRLRAAKYLIREQYAFAKQHEETDKRLMKMCKGIWLRLQYEYRLRLEAKRKRELIGAGDCNFKQRS